MIPLLIIACLVICFVFSFIVFCALANKKPTPSPSQKCDVTARYQPELHQQARQWHAMRYEKTCNVPMVINSIANGAPASE
jgi:hypothetical protein